MKNIPQKFLPLLSASFFLFSNKNRYESIKNEDLKENFISAKLDNIFSKKLPAINEKSPKQKKFVENLNHTKIYLLVTNNTSSKGKKKILLLLHTEDRINAEKSLVKNRRNLIAYKLRVKRKRRFSGIVYKKVVKRRAHPGIAKLIGSSTPYYINNLGGYKSICPVFFDKESAESFLLGSSKENLSFLTRKLPPKTKKGVVNGILNTKIVSSRLGDFIEYYSSQNNKNFLDKVEFLFFPNINETFSTEQINNQKVFEESKKKNFKFYQDKYLNLEK